MVLRKDVPPKGMEFFFKCIFKYQPQQAMYKCIKKSDSRYMILCFLCSLGAGLRLFSVLHACRLSFCFVRKCSDGLWSCSSGGVPSSEGRGFSRGGWGQTSFST